MLLSTSLLLRMFILSYRQLWAWASLELLMLTLIRKKLLPTYSECCSLDVFVFAHRSPRTPVMLCVQIPGDRQFLRYQNYQQQSFHSQKHLDHISSPFLCLVWATNEPLDYFGMYYA